MAANTACQALVELDRPSLLEHVDDSHAVVDMLEEARAVELDERLASGVRGHHSATSLLDAATRAGHTCLGWPEAGTIAAGGIADFVTLPLDSVRLAGTSAASAVEAAVFAASAADVDSVVCGGRSIVRDGVHRELDVAAELRETIGELLG